MSQIRKLEAKREGLTRRIIALVIVLVVLGLLAFGAYAVFEAFFAKKPAESFVPDDVISFVSISLKRSPDQDKTVKFLEARLGESGFIENTLRSLVFPNINEDDFDLPEEKKMKSWLGEKAGLAYFRVGVNKSLPAFILELKNSDLAREFLDELEKRSEKKGNVVHTEDFRNAKVTEIKGNTELSFAIYSNYLLVSQEIDGVKKMIDTRAGRFENLRDVRDYYLTKRKINTKEAIIFGYFNTLDFLKIFYGLSDYQDKAVLDQLSAVKKLNYLGLSFIPHEEGIEIKGYSRKNRITESVKAKRVKPKIVEKISQDAFFSLEGKDLRPLLNSIIFGETSDNAQNLEVQKKTISRLIQAQSGMDLENDFFALFDGQYSFVAFPFDDKILNIGMVSDIKGKKDVLGKLERVEGAVIKLVNENILKDEKEKAAFTDHTYKDIKYRYMNLPDKYNADIVYGMVDDYFIVTISEKCLQKIVDGMNIPAEKSLANNQDYQELFKKVKSGDPHQIVFTDVQKLLKALNKYVRFDYEKLDAKAKKLSIFETAIYQREDGMFFNGFLKVD